MRTISWINVEHQRQQWPNFDRYVIIATSEADDLLGTVQVEVWPEEQKFGGRVYLYALWVEERFRRQGVADAMMHYAEMLVRELGEKTITLEWDVRESPIEIRDWYESLGYDEKEFTPLKNALMVKRL